VLVAQGKLAEADQDFAHACLANPHATSGWFLRGYIAWSKRNVSQADAMLAAVRTDDRKPPGAVLEGDVRRRMYSEAGFLNIFEQQWDGTGDPARAYAQLHAYLVRLR
jgi:hypothetical protein